VLLTFAVLLGSSMAFFVSMPARAQPPEAVASETEAQADTPAEAAAHINELIAGKLSPSIDPAELFQASFAPTALDRARLLLNLVGDSDLLKSAKAGDDNPLWSGIPSDSIALIAAQAEFLRLPERQRERLLADHAVRRERELEATRAAASAEQQKQELQERANAIQLLLDGQPTDLSLLDFQLLDPEEVALNRDRRKAATASASPDLATPATGPTEPPPPPETLDEVKARLDALRARLLALPSEEITRLMQVQVSAPDQTSAIAQAEAEAEEAARAAAVATAEAERASTELLRLAAQQRSGLLLVQGAQAEFEADLSRRDAANKAIAEVMLRWRREVRELKAVSRLTPGRDENADQIYSNLVEALRQVRSDLDASLSSNTVAAVPAPPQIDSALPLDDPGFQPLQELRTALVARASELAARAEAQQLEERVALFDAMADMNATRLDLIPELSASMRGQTVGFGEAGIAQVGREINQIALTARYNLATAPQQIERTLYPFLHPTPQTLFSLLQAGFAVFVFFVWRRAGNMVLARAILASVRRKPPTLVSAATASVLRYYRDVRHPAEWLVLLLLLRWTLADTLVFIGDQVVWTVLFWFLLGQLLVQLANSLAHDRRQVDPYAALRLKSLKLLAGAGAGVGMVLSITTELVGTGAIHNWVLSFCWLLVPVIAIVLANWWRERIHLLAEKGAPKNAILNATSRNRTGPFGQVMLVLAGAVIIAQGVWNVVARRMRTIALIREIADQRNRKRAVAQAAEDAASGKYEAIGAAESDVLEPHRLPLSVQSERKSFATDSLHLEPGRLLAIVGERGLGKTTALSDLLGSVEGRTLRIQVRACGADDLMRQLDEAFGPEAHSSLAPEDSISCVVIDDAQRLVVPAIGGLRALDDLVAFARRNAHGVCWVLAIGGPAMTYLARARSDRTVFDDVLRLPRWETADIRALIERRTAQADFSPSFSHLHDLSFESLASEEDPDERGRRAYFENLTDYSGGNPAIALEFWRRSLFRNLETGQVEVRTFARPAADKLASLPDPAIFVLRTLIQIEQTDAATIQACTDYDMVVVRESLHRLEQLGVVMQEDGTLRVALHWYVEVVRLLERQNLLIRNAA